MTDAQQKLLNTWIARLKVVTQAHYASAARVEKQHFSLGVFSIVFTAVLASKFIFSIGFDATEAGKIVLGFIGLISICLSSFQLFFRLPERAEKFRVAGLSFASLLRHVENLAISAGATESDVQTATLDLLEKWEQLAKVSPTALPKVWSRQTVTISLSDTNAPLREGTKSN